MAKSSSKHKANEPVIENRRARHDYHIDDTLECGVKLLGTEIKALRTGQMSIGEGYVRVVEDPPSLTLHGAHIAEYPPAGPRQHAPTRERILLAHRKEIRKLATRVQAKGATIVPLKVYFVRGRAKVLIGVGMGKKQSDKRQDIARREAQRDMDRALKKR